MPRWLYPRIGSLESKFGIISFSAGTGSLPGSSRFPYLNGRFPFGSNSPGGLGGYDSHLHEDGGAHIHAVSGGNSSEGVRGDLSTLSVCSTIHAHASSNSSSARVTVSLASNLPPYFKVIAQLSKFVVGIPNLGLAFYNASSPPAGWSFCDGSGGTPDTRNRFLVGAGIGEGGGGTGGTSDAHTHDNTHVHGNFLSASNNSKVRSSGMFGNFQSRTGHKHTLSLASVSIVIANADAQPPFKKLLCVQNTSGVDSAPSGIITSYMDAIAKLPAEWVLCDGTLGTPDLRGVFVKCANSGAEVGATGGGAQHLHIASNHNNHSVIDYGIDYSMDSLEETTLLNSHYVHTHPWTVGSAVVTIANCASEAAYPLYRKVAFIMKT